MKNVLFIAYQFPPRGGPGVHRSTNFVKYLRDYGYNPIVITTDEETIDNETKLKDTRLLENIVEDTCVYRISNKGSIRFYKWLLRSRLYYPFWFLFYPLMFDWSVIWALKSIPRLKKIIKEKNISIVYTSSAPYSSWIIGYFFKKRMGLKWVADIRDPFTDGYMWVFPSRLHWLLIRKFEKFILGSADRVIVNTPEVKKLFIETKGLDPDKITYITNGY